MTNQTEEKRAKEKAWETDTEQRRALYGDR